MSRVRQFKTTDNVVHDIYGQNVQGMDWDDYELLTPEQRNSDIAYFVPDAPSGLTLVEQTVSGLPAVVASFSNAADVPLKTLKVSIVPVQSGSGDPSPSNPRPISGWTGANISVRGYNIWDEEWEVGGINSSGNNSTANDRIRSTNYNPCKPSTTYYLKTSMTTNELRVSYYDVNKNFISQTGWLYNGAFTTPTNAYYFRFHTSGVYGATYNNDISINYPSTDTTYHAHTGSIIPISWQTETGEVFGGELDVTSGVLTDKLFKISGTDITTLSLDSTNPTTTTFTFSYNANNLPKGKSNTVISNRFSRSTPLGTVGRLVNTATQVYFIVPTNELQTVDMEGGKQWLVDNPTDFIYEVDSPTTYQLTPTQVSSILGTNNIWADCGQINECTYYIYGQGTKPQLYFNDDVYVGSEVIANPEDAVPTEKLNKLAINGIVYDINPNVGERAIIDKLYEASTGDGAPLTTAINYTGGHKLSDYDIITVTLCDPTTYTGSIFSQVYSFSPKSLKSSGAQIPYFPIIMNGINDSECTVFFNENSFTVITHSGDTGEEPSVYSVYGLKFNTVAITEDIAGGDWTSLISQTGGSWSTATALPDGTTHVAVFLEYNNSVDMPFIFSVAEYDKIAQLSGNSIVKYGLAWKIGSDYDDIAYEYDSANGTVAVYAAYSGITIKAYAIAAKAAQIDVPIMQGATSSADGDKGLVPTPLMGDEDKYLKGDGTWATPSGDTAATTTYDNTTSGLVADDVQEAIDEVVSAKVSKAGTGEVTIQNCNFVNQFESANKCNPQTNLWGKGIASDGSIVDQANEVTTAIIPVANNQAWFGRNGSSAVAHRMALYDSNMTFKSRVTPSSSYDVSNYAYIQVAFAGAASTDVFYVGFTENSSTQPQIDTYNVALKIKPQYIDYVGGENINFNGLSGVAFGTSLTARAEEDHKYETTTYGYLTYLRQYSGMTIDNQGIGGATIMSDNVNKSIYLAITNYDSYANKKICIVEGFVNDWDNENTIGTFTDSGTTTVCGRIRNAIQHILTQNPNITIIGILDHYGKNSGGEYFSSDTVKNNLTQYQYYEEIYKVFESMGIKCIKEYAMSEIGELTPQYLADYIHMNDLGAKQSAKTIWSIIKQYYPNVKSGE